LGFIWLGRLVAWACWRVSGVNLAVIGLGTALDYGGKKRSEF